MHANSLPRHTTQTSLRGGDDDLKEKFSESIHSFVVQSHKVLFAEKEPDSTWIEQRTAILVRET